MGSTVVHPLDGSRLKVQRAREHLKTLDDEMRAFSDSEPYRVVTEQEPETHDYVWRVFFNRPDVRPPDHLAVVAGDAIHNLRSALDYLAWQLAIIGRGADRGTYFPLFEDFEEYRRKKPHPLGHVLDRHRTMVERLQPYHVWAAMNAGTGFPLANYALLLIGRLDNWDKHRLLLTGATFAVFRPPVIRNLRRAKIKAPIGGFRVDDGAELYRITEIEALDPTLKMDVESRLPFSVSFGDPSIPSQTLPRERDRVVASGLDLEQIADQIAAIIDSFAPEFP
jgi:hypothetical protein